MTTPQRPMSQLWQMTITVPSGTQPNAPQLTPWVLADANLDYIEIIVPDGHSYITGVAIYWAGTQIVPWGYNSWLLANAEKLHIPVDSYITMSGLVVKTYNQGIYPHTFYLRAHVSYPASQAVAPEVTPGSALILPSDTGQFDNSLTPNLLLAETSPVEITSLPEIPAEAMPSILSLPEMVK